MRKKWASRLLAMMLTGVTVVSMMPANIAHAEEADGQQGTTYYVSSQNGDDANDGTSEKKAFKTLDKINEITLGPGDKVLITGPGFMGLMCNQLAKLCGAYTIISGTPADKARLELALKQGADRVVDNGDDLKKVVEEVTDGGVDIVLECSGSPYAIPGALDAIRKQGAWTQVGMYGKDVTVAMDTINRKELDFKGTFATANSTWEKLVKLYELDKLQLDDYVSARIPLENWKEGFEMFQRKEGIKLFLVP